MKTNKALNITVGCIMTSWLSSEEKRDVIDVIRSLESKTTVKIEQEKSCEYCEDNFEFWQTEIIGSLPNVNYCPMCGRELETENNNERAN